MNKTDIILNRIEKEVSEGFGAKNFTENEAPQLYAYLKSNLIGQDTFKIENRTYVIEFNKIESLETIYIEEVTKINKYSVIRYLKELKIIKSKNPQKMNEIIMYWENKLIELLIKEK